MPDRIQIIAIAGSALLFLFIIEMVRRRRLRVEYSILWLAATGVFLSLSVFRSILERFASLVGIYYAPAALFLVAMVFGVMLFIHFSIVISRLSGQNTVLAQRIALLEAMLDAKGAQERSEPPGGGSLAAQGSSLAP
jgi:hypothetical protein